MRGDTVDDVEKSGKGNALIGRFGFLLCDDSMAFEISAPIFDASVPSFCSVVESSWRLISPAESMSSRRTTQRRGRLVNSRPRCSSDKDGSTREME